MIILLMGVAGCGKTTVGKLLSDSLKWQFIDADDFHPPENIDKMNRGIPLDDADRWPWLESLRGIIQESLDANRPAIVACSALKESYRRALMIDDRVRLVYLEGSYELISSRLTARRDHYMNPDLLRSQFATLEEPADALRLDVVLSPAVIVDTIKRRFALVT
jgi:gluconokinase